MDELIDTSKNERQKRIMKEKIRRNKNEREVL